MSRVRHRTAADAAAAFQASYLERTARQRMKKRASRATNGTRRKENGIPPAPQNRRDLETVPIYLPFETFKMLIEHCDHYGIRPATYIKRMLMMSTLSKGGF